MDIKLMHWALLEQLSEALELRKERCTTLVMNYKTLEVLSVGTKGECGSYDGITINKSNFMRTRLIHLFPKTEGDVNELEINFERGPNERLRTNQTGTIGVNANSVRREVS